MFKAPLSVILAIICPSVLIGQEMKDHPGAVYEIGISLSYYQSTYLVSGIDETLIRAELYDPDLYSAKSNERDSRAVLLQIPVQLHRNVYVKPLVGFEWVNKESSSDFSYSDEVGLDYDIWLNYRYVRFGGEIGFSLPLFTQNNEDGFIHNGLTLQAGVGYSTAININPNELRYVSNDPLTGPDEQIQLDLSEVLEGKTLSNGHFAGRISYKGLFVSFIKHFDNEDVLLTKANEYNFIDNENSRSNAWMLGVGITLPLFSWQDYTKKGDQLHEPARMHFAPPFHRKL
ncbi:MAG: hypothetical protein WBG42_00685 [Cryomorphaceae bacterium]